MKANAHLYLPWSVVAELAASARQSPSMPADRLREAASVEHLDGGCMLYRLASPHRCLETH
jgi:hypothetical protein